MRNTHHQLAYYKPLRSHTCEHLQEKCEEKTTIKTGGSTVTRNGEPENPAYVLAMDQGSKAGKEVLKKVVST